MSKLLKGLSIDYDTNVSIIEYILNNPQLNNYIIDILKSRINDKSNEVVILTIGVYTFLCFYFIYLQLMEMLAKNIDSLASKFADKDFLDYLTDYGKPEEHV